MFKVTTLAVVFAVPVLTNGSCDPGCNPGGSGGGGTVDPGTSDECLDYVGQATRAELDATPRPRPDLELLALALDPGDLTASPATYDRLLADVTAAAALDERVAGITYWAAHDGARLLLSADASTLSAMAAGTYADWDCANAWYGLNEVTVHSSFAVLEFPGTFALERLAEEYGDLPGVTFAEPDSRVGDGSTVCVLRDGASYEYLFDQASGDCPSGCIDHTYRRFLSDADGNVTAGGSWSTSAPVSTRPDWLRLEDCP